MPLKFENHVMKAGTVPLDKATLDTASTCSDLNPVDGGQSLYPMSTVFYVLHLVLNKKIVSAQLLSLDFRPKFRPVIHRKEFED